MRAGFWWEPPPQMRKIWLLSAPGSPYPISATLLAPNVTYSFNMFLGCVPTSQPPRRQGFASVLGAAATQPRPNNLSAE